VLRRPPDGQKCNGYNHGEHGRQHDEDEPRSPICGLGRGLGDAHGVDESVRDEEEELHVNLDGVTGGIVAGFLDKQLNRNKLRRIQWNEGLPEWWRAHTLKDV
jgi:hypothetical protein